MRIFISGCSHTGTTLMKRLFHAFEEVTVIPREISLVDFIERKGKTLVGKRSQHTIFSEDITNIEEQLEILRRNNISVLVMTRKYEDIKDVPEKRKDACIKQLSDYKDDVCMVISYEKLIESPNEIQKQIAERFGFTIRHLFSSYPDFVPPIEFEKAVGGYNRRPIGKDERIIIATSRFGDQIYPIPTPDPLTTDFAFIIGLGGRNKAKEWALRPHMAFPQHDITVIHSSKFRIVTDIRPYVKKYLSDADVAMLPIGFGCHDAYDVGNFCAGRVANAKIVKKQLDRYHNLGLPKGSGAWSTGIMMTRIGKSHVQRFFDDWYKEYVLYPTRSQISLGFVVWKHRMKVNTIKERDKIWTKNPKK